MSLASGGYVGSVITWLGFADFVLDLIYLVV